MRSVHRRLISLVLPSSLLICACKHATEPRSPTVNVPDSDAYSEPEPAPGHPIAGELDPTFGENGFIQFGNGHGENRLSAVAVLADGSIAAAGHAKFEDGHAFAAVRLTRDGQPDRSFGRNGVVRIGKRPSFGQAIAVDGNRRVIAGGYLYRTAGDSDLVLARFDASGALDRSFGEDGIAQRDFGNHDQPAAVLVDGDRIIVPAQHTRRTCQAIAFHAGGSLDTSFGENGRLLFSPRPDQKDAFVTRAALAPDGKIVMGGYGPQDNGGWVARLTRDGRLDPTFGDGGRVFIERPSFWSSWAVGVDRRRRILLAGGPRNGGARVARLLPDGRLDPAWSRGGIATTGEGNDDQLYAFLIDSDDNLIGAGFRDLADDAALLVARFSPRGALDRRFGERGIVTRKFARGGTFVFAAALDAEGRVVVAGETYVGEMWSKFFVARYR